MNKSQLLSKTVQFYQRSLPAALDFFSGRGIDDIGLLERHGIGYCDGSMIDALPSLGEIIDGMKQLGILDDAGDESFLGHVTIPILDENEDPINLIGMDVRTSQVKVMNKVDCAWNIKAVMNHHEIYQADTILDALLLETLNIENVVVIFGNPANIKANKIRRINLPADCSSVHAFIEKHGMGKLHSILRDDIDQDAVTRLENGFELNLGKRRYEIISPVNGNGKLKATVKVERCGRNHVDTVDFYSSQQVKRFLRESCLSLDENKDVIEHDIQRVVKLLETTDFSQDEKQSEISMTDEEIEVAKEFGRSENLLDEVVKDFEKMGVVGEDDNKLMCYLAMTSRKMSNPMSILILSNSGAGKSNLMNTCLKMCPEQDLIKVTRLSALSLMYRTDSLKNKVLAIEEDVGANEANYAIRNLISANELVIETTVKGNDGKLTTMTNRVEGPVCVFITSVNPDSDHETVSRFFVISIDESKEQTKRILAYQKYSYGLESLNVHDHEKDVIRRHRHFQRLLQPVRVVNPLVDEIKFQEDDLQSRRNQPKLLNLISTIAFLRQMRKRIKFHGDIEYIEVDDYDLKIGTELYNKVFGTCNRDLSQPTANLLQAINELTNIKAKNLEKENNGMSVDPNEMTFTRRELRDHSGWTYAKVNCHLRRLLDLEYVVKIKGGRGTIDHFKVAAP